MSRPVLFISCVFASVMAIACAEPAGDTDSAAYTPDDFATDYAFPAPEYDATKADNYISTNAREFVVRGDLTAALPEGFADLSGEERALRLQSTINSHSRKVSSAVRNRLKAAASDANDGVTGDDATYFTYFRSNSELLGDVLSTTDDTVTYQLEMQLVASPYLMHYVSPGENERRSFTVELTNGYGSWGSSSSSSSDEAEVVELTIEGSASRDAFPKYNEMFEDGIYDIAVHFGGDYNEGRHDIETAKWLVETLVEHGWESDVRTFEDLKIDSGPFTRKLEVEGSTLEARVYIYHSDMVEAAEEEKLADVMRESFAERDIVIYSGHAGSNAGFILDYQPKFEIDDKDFKDLPMADKYQIFVLDGCMTYRTYVDQLLANPAKTYENVDIVTTVNTTPFGLGYQVLHEFVYWLTLTDQLGRHYPLTWQTILRGVNLRSFKTVHYGVHGIDADPGLNPHGGEDMLCSPCRDASECGPGGNICLNIGGQGACGVACASDSACPDGYRCARLTDDPDLFHLPKQCIPRDYQCR